ncbi:MAG: C-GCAxxG-C-C family protein [Dehalococcoidales bacterium]|nr:C-GCAxxG-C-C family protein [Dehalococcoidales bacterium]
MQVMWETSDMKDKDILWAGIAFEGGIGGHQHAPCGAISAAAVYLGLSYRCPMEDKPRARQARQDARKDAYDLAAGFKDRFGTIICRGLVKVDLSKPEESQKLTEISKDRCDKFVEFVISKLYELAEKKTG